jgi:hypothetical protein
VSIKPALAIGPRGSHQRPFGEARRAPARLVGPSAGAARAHAHDIRSEYAPDWREPGQIPYAFPKAIRVLYQWGTALDRGMV